MMISVFGTRLAAPLAGRVFTAPNHNIRTACHWFRIATFAVLSLGPSMLSAQVRMPLEGYCRAGRCMPVYVEATARSFEMLGSGIVPTEISAGIVGIVPLLVLNDAPGPIQSNDAGLTPLHPLAPNERLVGIAGSDARVPPELFPGQTIVTVNLGSIRALRGPAMAWETLDALLLDSAPEADEIPKLLATGMAIVLRSEKKPDEAWPWKRLADCWVLRGEICGTRGSIGTDVAYLPAAQWRLGMSAALRREIVLCAVAISLLMLACLLIRSRRSIVVMIVIVVLSCSAIEMARRKQPSMHSTGGRIVVALPSILQTDEWQFQAAGSSGANGKIERGRPILVDPAQAERIGLKVVCVGNSQSWTYSLPAGNRLAVLNRTIELAHALPQASATSQSPLYELARQGYLTATTRIVGGIPPAITSPDENEWPTVVVGRD